MPVILDIQAIEIGRIEVRSQLRQKVQETPPHPISTNKNAGCGGSYLPSQLLRKCK
jgi:hypothetical protein